MPDYFTNIDMPAGMGSDRFPDLIGVFERPEQTRPIGIASLLGETDNGMALWRLNVRGADLPGQWVILGKWFLPDEG